MLGLRSVNGQGAYDEHINVKGQLMDKVPMMNMFACIPLITDSLGILQSMAFNSNQWLIDTKHHILSSFIKDNV